MCAKHTYLGPERCTRRIGAARLEEFVMDAAVELLTHLDVTGAPSAATALAPAEQAAISANEAELAELKDRHKGSRPEFSAEISTIPLR